MDRIYEMYGRLAEQLDRETTEHLRTIDVLRQLKAGTLTIDKIEVTERGWTVTAEPKEA